MSKEIRRPSPFVYYTAGPLVSLLYKLKYNIKIDKSALKGIKPPFIALASHCSNTDYITVGAALMPYRMNYVASSIFFKSKKTRTLLSLVGAIEKRQFVPDIQCVKDIFSVIKRGGSVMLFPSAQVGYTGENAEIDDNTVKLIKKLGVPVVGVHIDGAYLTLPKWSKLPSKGKIEARAFVMFTPEQLKQLSNQELLRQMVDALAWNDFEWQKSAHVAYSPHRSTTGLENVLHMCPACLEEYAMRSDGERFYCESCGYETAFDAYGSFTGDNVIFDNAVKWHEFQTQKLAERAAKPDFFIEHAVTLMTTIDGKPWYHPCGRGTARLDREGLVYVGTDGEQTVRYEFPKNCQTAITHTSGLGFDFHKDATRTLCFSPDDRRVIVDYVEAFNYIKK